MVLEQPLQKVYAMQGCPLITNINKSRHQWYNLLSGSYDMKAVKEIMTPDQVADYLQLNKETVYRYIREGKLGASRLGRSYRIPKANVDLFLLATSTSQTARQSLTKRLESVAERNRGIPFEEVEKDVAETIADIRHRDAG